MMLGGETKRFSWLRFESNRDKLDRLSRENSDLRDGFSRVLKELSATEALLAEAQRKLSAGGRAQADRHKQKIWAKAAELRG